MLGAVESYYKFPHNIVDAFGVDEEAREAGVFVIKKIVWDITFQMIFSYVLISMVCGIIVGTFLIQFVLSVCLSVYLPSCRFEILPRHPCSGCGCHAQDRSKAVQRID
jgi:ABC-type microcin C transport system permease subunit YejE